MNIVAALSWWNERPQDLVACVFAISPFVDRIVALDGAYMRYPDGTPSSPPEQAEAICDTARDHGVEPTILTPHCRWAGEPEKRSYLMATAAIESDWIIVVDADHIASGDPEQLRDFLSNQTLKCFKVPFSTPVDNSKSIESQTATNWHHQETEQIKWYPLIMASFPGFRVERKHWWYSGIHMDKRYWIGEQWTPQYQWFPSIPVRCDYAIEHRALYRTPEQIRAARAWYNDRVMVVETTGQENAVPGLPPVNYDFITRPF